MAGKSATMKDVASLAGVSVQTVSCVVNGTGNISAETRLRVTRAIETLNYKHDLLARSLRTGQTRIVALLVLDITNPVLSTIASKVEAAAYASGYNVLLYNVGQDAQREHSYLDDLASPLVDGILIVNALDRSHTFALLTERAIPTVLVDCLATTTLPSVAVDNAQGAYLAVQHLAGLGHRHIAHLSGATTLEVARQRIAGYHRAMSDLGLGQNVVIAPESDRWDYASGYQSMRHTLAAYPHMTAVVVAGDQMAIGAYQALTEAGLCIPEDMSVVGFDDIEAAQYAQPPLTTIRQPLDHIASQAFTLLKQFMDEETPDSRQVILPPELVVRESTSAPRQQ